MIPAWLLWLLFLIAAAGVGFVAWVWRRVWTQYQAADAATSEAGLKLFARAKLVRVTILLFGAVTTCGVYALVVIFTPPRPPIVNAAMRFGLIAITLVITLLSFHEFVETRLRFDRTNSN